MRANVHLVPALDFVSIGIVVVIHALSLLPAVYLNQLGCAWSGSALFLAFGLPAGFVVYALCFIAVNAAARWSLAPRLPVGIFARDSVQSFAWMRTTPYTAQQQGLLVGFLRTYALFRWLYYRSLGMKLALVSIIAPDCQIYDPEHISIGYRSVLGGNALVAAHLFAGRERKLEIRPVVIGARCLIGSGSLINCGVTIGDDAIVGEHAVIGANANIGQGASVLNLSYVRAGQMIPAGEVWAGAPARKVRDQDA